MDAIKKLLNIVKVNNKKGNVVGMLTLDVCNAFNTAPWDSIIEALREMQVPTYLQDIIRAYLSDRKVTYTLREEKKEFTVETGVPQGSVLGPYLWNIMYNGLLKQTHPNDVEIIAFADDAAIVALAKHSNFLEEKLEESFATVSRWMRDKGLMLAEHKTEAIVFTRRYTRNSMRVKCGNTIVNSGKSIKYLGLTLDQKLTFVKHSEQTAKKTADTSRKLGYILPNLGGCGQSKQKILSCVVMSKLLYGVPCWEEHMTVARWKKVETVQRRMAIKTAASYKTVSHEAIAVVSSTMPLKLLAKQYSESHNQQDKKTTKERLMNKWQEDWDNASKGRWTHRLIPDVKKWVNRNHGEVNYHLTQFLTGHGCYGEYLHRFHRRISDECQLCGVRPDTAEHAVFECDAWTRQRREIEGHVGQEVTADNVTTMMTASKENWKRIDETVGMIMRKREEIERQQEKSANEQLRNPN